MTALTATELSDVRRFTGYPVSGAVAGLDPTVQTTSNSLDQVLAGLSSEQLLTVRAALASLRSLEAAVLASSANLDTAQASVWKHDSAELANRIALYTQWRLWLCSLLGSPPGPGVYLLAPLPGTSGSAISPLPPAVLVV